MRNSYSTSSASSRIHLALLNALIHQDYDQANVLISEGADINAELTQQAPLLPTVMSQTPSETWPALIHFAVHHGLSATPNQGQHVVLAIKHLMDSDLDHSIMKTLTTLLSGCAGHIDLTSPLIRATMEDLHDRNFHERRPNPILRVEALSHVLDHYQRGYPYEHITNYTAAQGAIIEGLHFERPEDKPILLEANPHEFGGSIVIALFRPDENAQLLLKCKPAVFASCAYGTIKGQYYRDHAGHETSNVIEDLIGAKIQSIDLLTNLRLEDATMAITLDDGRILRILSYLRDGAPIQRISISTKAVNPKAIDHYQKMPTKTSPIKSAH